MFSRFSKRNDKKPSNGRFAHGNEHLIDVRQVVKTFDTAAGKFTALKGVNMQVDPGEFVAVIGKSGSGKSTLINMLTGIDRPTSGEVLIGDTAVHTLNEGQMAQWRGRNVGVVFQFFQLLPTLTVVENVMLPMDFCHMYTPRQRRERAMDLLAQVELDDQAHKLPSAISGGQQQRAAIARALANDPPIITADEPTGNLDSKTAESVFQMFERLVAQGKTILMVTHDQDLSKRAKRTVVIADGEIVDEYLARALPGLNEEQLLRATKKLAPVQYAAGETILKPGETSDKFCIVNKGVVDVVLVRPDGPETVVDHLGRGQFFGVSSLMQRGKRNVLVRTAPNTPVELCTLDRETFVELLRESKLTKEEIERVISERVNQLETAAGR
ncbi:MAG: ATP-binding cassette domain-containing protein [Chloroflexota bacterium]